jgi:hypothetical protein
VKLRPGRKNPRTLYLQLGVLPSDDDPCLGLMIDIDTAALLAGLTSPWHLNEIRLSTEGRQDR